MFSLYEGWTRLPNNPVPEIQTLTCITTDQKFICEAQPYVAVRVRRAIVDVERKGTA